MNNLSNEVIRAIDKAMEKALHHIGSVIDGEAREAILAQKIYDKGDYYRNTTYIVRGGFPRYEVRFGSNVRHEPYVLGGKEPSWTPFAPIKSWVERKGLSWVDKRGKVLNVNEIAWMIIYKIKRNGIKGRNVYETIMKNREKWIYQRLRMVKVEL